MILIATTTTTTTTTTGRRLHTMRSRRRDKWNWTDHYDEKDNIHGGRGVQFENRIYERPLVARRRLESGSSASILLFLLTISFLSLVATITSGHLQDDWTQTNNDDEQELSIIGSADSAVAQTDASRRQVVGASKKRATSDSSSTSIENDPFAFTFEDYLREASRSSHHRASGSMETTRIGEEDENEIPRRPSPVVFEEQDTGNDELHHSPHHRIAPASSSKKIDYIFPPASSEVDFISSPAGTANKQTEQQLTNEIRLLFAWRSLPTNKCSKDCGRGFRLNHLSCIDLKFNVRVEDELCDKAQLARPSEVNFEEPCNEHDCPIERNNHDACMRINSRGEREQVNNSLCQQSSDSDTIEYSLDISREQEHNNEISKHQVLRITTSGSEFAHQTLADEQRNGEPFFQAGEWSACSGAECGHLGTRVRKIQCRLYLARSSKLVTLAESSCQALGLQVPHADEPCYMDCHADVSRINSSSHTSGDKTADQTEEEDDSNELTLHLDEVQRFVWRHEGWTKCSADCLGGFRESLVECWDKVAEQVVNSSRCESWRAREKPRREACNEIACAPEWRLEPFGECSRPCGSAGVRTRSLACVQLVPLQTGQSSYMLVNNELCLQSTGQLPHSVEPCNRRDCEPEWSLGPWDECRRLPEEDQLARCGSLGSRNRTIVCVQEFASREPQLVDSLNTSATELREAIALGAKHWHPGKAIQIPSGECLSHYKSVPVLRERCQLTKNCLAEGDLKITIGNTITRATHYIDSEPSQDFNMWSSNHSSSIKRKTITLKVGGRAQVLEGRTLKIRCKLMQARNKRKLNELPTSGRVEWFKDGVRIFSANSTYRAVEKQLVDQNSFPMEEDNSILTSDLLVPPPSAEQLTMAADEPVEMGRLRNNKQRKIQVRSSSNDLLPSFQFVPRLDGRFSLTSNSKSTLKIKRLRQDDSGLYTCSVGELSESLEVNVVGRQQQQQQQRHHNHQQPPLAGNEQAANNY